MAGPHDHIAWFGDDLDDLYRLAIDVLGAGARRGEKLLFIADAPDPAGLSGLDGLEALLSDGRLELLATDSVYPSGASFNEEAQLKTFQAVLQEALAQGYTGLRVVADNTMLASGRDWEYERWIAWEELTDHFQATAPVTGFCYFHQPAIDKDRQVILSAVHPVRSDTALEPPFTFTATECARIVTGSLDSFSAPYFRQVIAAAPDDEPLVVDLGYTEFVDHRALFILAKAATASRPVVIHGAPSMLKNLVVALGIDTRHLSFR
jgi:anti-anti-sigma regulatory factor